MEVSDQPLSPMETTLSTYWIGGCVSTRAHLDAVEYRNISTTAVQPAASSLLQYQITYPALSVFI
jgi:hypothetical protein